MAAVVIRGLVVVVRAAAAMASLGAALLVMEEKVLGEVRGIHCSNVTPC